jgi:TolB protein
VVACAFAILVTSVMTADDSAPAEKPVPAASLPRQLTNDGFLKRDPVFWPGGRQLIYSVEARSLHMRLMRMTLSDKKDEPSKVELFHKKKDYSDRELAVSKDGSIYAYNVVRGLSTKIVVRDTKSDRTFNLPGAGIANWSHWPTISPDGKRIVFTEGAGPMLAYDIEKNPGKAGLVWLTKKDASYSDLMPRYRPDGARIVFTSRRDNDFEIYDMKPDASDQRRLTKSKGLDMRPVFSPDGKRIAFLSNRDGNYEIYVMSADGKNPRRVTNHPERDDFPCWHPDGEHLVIVSERSGRFDLFLIDVPR